METIEIVGTIMKRSETAEGIRYNVQPDEDWPLIDVESLRVFPAIAGA